MRPLRLIGSLIFAAACSTEHSQAARDSGAARAPASATSAAIHWPANPEISQLASSYDSAGRVAIPVCSEHAPVLTSDSLGPLRAGMTAAAVVARCPHAQALWDWGDEGTPEPALLMRFGPALIVATVDDTLGSSRVYRVATSDSAARTAAGVGPSSLFSDVRQAYGTLASLEAAECVLYATFEREPGLEWKVRLSSGGTSDCEQVEKLAAAGRRAAVPRDARVLSVIQVTRDGSLTSAEADKVSHRQLASLAIVMQPLQPSSSRLAAPRSYVSWRICGVPVAP